MTISTRSRVKTDQTGELEAFAKIPSSCLQHTAFTNFHVASEQHVGSAANCLRERVSSFLTAHQHILGYLGMVYLHKEGGIIEAN